MSARVRRINGYSSPHRIFPALSGRLMQLWLRSSYLIPLRGSHGDATSGGNFYNGCLSTSPVEQHLPPSLGLNFGGRITVSTICQSCLILLTCMRCTLEPRSFKYTFVIGGEVSLRSVIASIQWTVTRAMTDLPHTCQPEAL